MAHAGKPLAQDPLASHEFLGGHAVPLEGGVGFRGEIADRQVELEAADIAHLETQPLHRVGDAVHIVIGLTRQADHEIELDLSPAITHRRLDALAELLIRQTLVDDVAQALGARFRRKGESALTGAAQDVGDVVVKAIDALTRQRQADVVLLQAIAELHPDGGQGEVVTAAQGQQREIAVTGLNHPGLHGLDHLIGIDVPRRSGQHPRLAEAAPTGAAAADLHREAVMHRLHMGHQSHRVVRHGRGHPADHPPFSQGRHVNPWHVSEIAQQR